MLTPTTNHPFGIRLGHVSLIARLDVCRWAAPGSSSVSGGCSNMSSSGADLTDAQLVRQIRDFLEHIDAADRNLD